MAITGGHQIQRPLHGSRSPGQPPDRVWRADMPGEDGTDRGAFELCGARPAEPQLCTVEDAADILTLSAGQAPHYLEADAALTTVAFGKGWLLTGQMRGSWHSSLSDRRGFSLWNSGGFREPLPQQHLHPVLLKQDPSPYQHVYR